VRFQDTPLADLSRLAVDRASTHFEKLKVAGAPTVEIEGMAQADWVLIDAGDVIVHIFRPEVREFYNLEKMWSADRPMERLVI